MKSDREIIREAEQRQEDEWKLNPHLWRICNRCNKKSYDVSKDSDRDEFNCDECYEELEDGKKR